MSVLQYAMDSLRNLILNKDDNCINSCLFHHFSRNGNVQTCWQTYIKSMIAEFKGGYKTRMQKSKSL